MHACFLVCVCVYLIDSLRNFPSFLRTGIICYFLVVVVVVPLAVIKICHKGPAIDLLYLDRNEHDTIVCSDIGSCDLKDLPHLLREESIKIAAFVAR